MIVGVLLRRLDDGEGSFAEVSAAIDRLELLDPPSTWLWSDPQKRFGALLGATPISTTSSTRSGEDAAPARPLPRAAWRRRWLWRGDPTKGHGQHALATHANPLAHATDPRWTRDVRHPAHVAHPPSLWTSRRNRVVALSHKQTTCSDPSLVGLNRTSTSVT